MPNDLQTIEYLAKLMDDEFSFMGFNFGLNFILGLVPEVGDIVSTLIAIYLFSLAVKYKISAWAALRMIFNIMVYFLVGLIPWLGDIFGAWWKPNRRNLKILQKQLQPKT